MTAPTSVHREDISAELIFTDPGACVTAGIWRFSAEALRLR
jgi:hypothetical protein